MAAELPKIIGLVGPIRAGKTTVTKYLVEKYGYITASNSDVLREILDGMGIPSSRENLGRLGNSIFKVLGNDIIAKYRLDNLNLGRIVVDGIRYPEEIKRYSEVESFKLLAVTAGADVRFDRTLRDRTELKDVGISREAFDDLVLSRSELDVPQLVSRADEVIINERSFESLKQRIDQTLKKWSFDS
ncbi:AAA family ATPase [Pseudomonas sp. NBRC 111138]|uniref:AAA family ATPase n=1 Tax=Pseudomonas sp. NBRC 111138 TaxID=1661053 RepID=UPI0006D3E820|nr:AAA family ATPase [Pseudomonas sp. NBRC 111138]